MVGPPGLEPGITGAPGQFQYGGGPPGRHPSQARLRPLLLTYLKRGYLSFGSMLKNYNDVLKASSFIVEIRP